MENDVRFKNDCGTDCLLDCYTKQSVQVADSIVPNSIDQIYHVESGTISTMRTAHGMNTIMSDYKADTSSSNFSTLSNQTTLAGMPNLSSQSKSHHDDIFTSLNNSSTGLTETSLPDFSVLNTSDSWSLNSNADLSGMPDNNSDDMNLMKGLRNHGYVYR
tara:strand:- start:687 stop:1166 length:480 start_codon:yes stop_codon:yes gene_type:complete